MLRDTPVPDIEDLNTHTPDLTFNYAFLRGKQSIVRIQNVFCKALSRCKTVAVAFPFYSK